MERNNRIEDLRILVVGHVAESYGPMQALPKYLRKNVKELAVISHPFPFSGIPNSKCLLFKNGKVIREHRGPKYKTFYLIHHFGDIFLTLYFVLRMRRNWDLYIGSDCLNSFTGIVLRSLGVVSKAIFYEHDHTPERFKNKLLNRVFHYLNGFSARHADVVWDNPPNLSEIRRRQGADLRKVIRVPHGVDLDKITIPPPAEVKRHTLVYAGDVVPAKGLQLVVEAVKNLVQKIPQIKVAIVGSGRYEPELKKLVKEAKLENVFEFFGYTRHDWTLFYLPSCGVALAPYVDEAEGTFKYCEPLKVKDYLACGLPIIITKVPDFANEIEMKTLGVAINYDVGELEEAIVKLLTDDEFYKKCRDNVLKYAANITWDYTYGRTFSRTLRCIF